MNKMKMISMVMVAVLTFSSVFVTASAADLSEFSSSANSVSYDAAIIEVAQTYGITETEILNLEDNLEAAFSQIRGVQIQSQDALSRGASAPFEIPISENLLLELSCDVTRGLTRGQHLVTVSSTYHIKSSLGTPVLKYTANGVFAINGNTITPIDSYSSYESLYWVVTSVTDTVYSDYTRNTFDSVFDLNIAPVSVVFQTRRDNCNIRYSNGQGSAVWS